MVLLNLFAGRQWRCRQREQTHGYRVEGREERVGCTGRVNMETSMFVCHM